jgi:hypothetical protein
MRRPVWLAAGMALGVGGTLWAEQRVRRGLRRATERLTPEHVAAEARASARQLGGRVRDAVDAARQAHDTREAELWEDLDAGRLPPMPVGEDRWVRLPGTVARPGHDAGLVPRGSRGGR